MNFISSVQEIQKSIKSQNPNISWSMLCKELISLLQQYPGGITKTILDSHFQQVVAVAIQKETVSNVKFIQKCNWNLDKFYGNASKSMVYEGTLANRGLEVDNALLVSDSQLITFQIYFPELWIRYMDTMKDYLKPSRKIRFADSFVTSTKYLDHDGESVRNCIKFLPSASMLLLLNPSTDAQLLESTTFTDLTKLNSQEFNVVLLQIVDILAPSPNQCQINVRDSKGTNTQFMLWGNQIPVSFVFQKGDLLLIQNPFIDHENSTSQDVPIIELGTGSLCFLIPCSSIENIPTTSDSKISSLLRPFQQPVQKVSLSKIASNRITTKTVNTCLDGKSLDLFGRVIKVSRAEKENGEIQVGVRIQDEDGVIDLTCTSQTIVDQVKSLELGSYVMLFDVLPVSLPNTLQFVLVETESSSMINISKLPGILASSCLHDISYLFQVLEYNLDFFYCRAIVLQETLVSRTIIHKPCKSQVEDDDGILFCPACLQFVDDVTERKMYSLVLDDGTAQIKASGADEVLDNYISTNYGSLNQGQESHHFAIINFNGNYSIQIHCQDPPALGLAIKWNSQV